MAAFAPALLGAAGKALTSIKAGTIAKVSGVVGKEAAELMSKEVSKAAQNAAQKAGNTAKVSSRRRLDSAQERDRIVNLGYLNVYTKPWFDAEMRNAGNLTKAQLIALLPTLKSAVTDSYNKCKKVPCDTAGCRSMGALVLRQQYVEALIEAYNATGTTTPEEFNQQFTTAINEGKTSLRAGIGGILPILLILGALFGKFKR